MCLLQNSDPKTFGSLVTRLRNDYTLGDNKYPPTRTAAAEMLVSYISDPKNSKTTYQNPTQEPKKEPHTGLQFAQGSNLVKGIGAQKLYEYVKCHKCKKFGHYVDKCPGGESSNEVQLAIFGFTTHQGVTQTSPPTGTELNHTTFLSLNDTTDASTSSPDKDYTVLLVTGSTCSVFKNKNLLKNIIKTNDTLRVITNRGHQDSELERTLAHFFDVWYNPRSILKPKSLG